MQYKVGDWVRVRKDITQEKDGSCPCGWTNDFLRYLGKTGKISVINLRNNFFNIDFGSPNYYLWFDETLVIKIPECSRLKKLKEEMYKQAQGVKL